MSVEDVVGWALVRSVVVLATGGDVSREEDEILVERLGRLGGRGGFRGGRLGARLAARLLPVDVHEVELSLPLPPDDALAHARATLAALGRPVDETALADDRHELRAVVGAGALDANPAVVTLVLVATSRAETAVHVRGAAKEGLVRQHAGREAALRVAAALQPPT
jgi:hypothetical protein